MIRPKTDDDRRLTGTYRLTPGQPTPNASIGHEVVANTLLVVGIFAAFLVAGAFAGPSASIPAMVVTLVVALATAVTVPLALVRIGRELVTLGKWFAAQMDGRDRPQRRTDTDTDGEGHADVARAHRGIEPNQP